MLILKVILFAHLIWLCFYVFRRSEGRRASGYVGSGCGILALTIAMDAILLNDPGDAYVSAASIGTGLAIGAMATGLAMVFETGPWNGGRSGRSTLVEILLFLLPGLALVIAFEALDFEITWIALAVLGLGFLAGGIIAARRMSDESGEALLPDLVRSYDYSFLIAAVFGGQVALAMWSGPGATTPMLVLLLGTITAAIAIQVFLDRVQTILDHVAFANVPWLRQERAQLRQIENLLPRVNMTDPLTIPEEEFTRLTRRALSNYGDLTKLATSPLTNLPEVHRRLMARGVDPSTLERARELKVILAEAIERLKPMNGEEIGTTDEWRFYNALYYPYVVSMRPYSRTAVHNFDDAAHVEVLEWFRTYVPERTLYNWQNAAAALIAGYLREQEEIALSPGAAPAARLTTVG